MIVSLKIYDKKKYGLFILAVLLLLLGGVALFVGTNNFVIRSLGVIACLISVYCVRRSNIHAKSNSAIETSQQAKSKPSTQLRRSIWIISIVLLPMLGLAFLSLYRDALHGYQKAWPVYLFAGVVAICAFCWSYLMAKLLR